MSELTFNALDKQLFKFYEANDFAGVVALVEQEQTNFPDHTLELSYWHICMTSLLGKQEEALQLFHAAVDQGLWFAPDWLVADEDLVALHPLPEFQELVALCRQRLTQAQVKARPDLLVFPPVQKVAPLSLLIVLHGNMANARQTSEKWHEMTEWGWLLAVPQSSQISEQGKYVWDDRERSIHEVCNHLAALEKDFRVDTEQIVLGGFSKGGGLAIWLALHQLIPAKGFIVLAPSLSEEELEALSSLLATRRSAGIRGYIIVGEKDERFLKVSRLVVDMMQTHDLPCGLEIHAGMEHEYTPDFSASVARGLAFISVR